MQKRPKTVLGKDVQFRALFIEKDEAAYSKLISFLKEKEWHEIDVQPLQGEFFDLRENTLKWCGTEDFTFFFIDPTGWKNVVEISTLRPLLERPKSEYLINFMFDFILRAHSQEAFEKHMREIFVEVPNTLGMASNQKESFLLKLYRTHLKSASKSAKPLRTVYVKVMDPFKDRSCLLDSASLGHKSVYGRIREA